MFPAVVQPVMEWTAAQVDDDAAAAISGWPPTTSLESGARRVLFCHATPRDDNEIFTSLTPVERLEPVFEGTPADVVVCGHTHMQFSREVAGMRVVNAGSVGMPFDAPGAYWLALEGGEVEFRRVDYDFESAAGRIRTTEYPQAEDFAASNVLRPPARDLMEGRLEQGALGAGG